MILNDETYNAYGYWPQDLKHKSQKLIFVRCENPDCGEVRTVQRGAAARLCRLCAIKAKSAKTARKHDRPHPHLHLIDIQNGKAEVQKRQKCQLCGTQTPRTNRLCWPCEEIVLKKTHEINRRRSGISG